jgi:hypothetical protein
MIRLIAMSPSGEPLITLDPASGRVSLYRRQAFGGTLPLRAQDVDWIVATNDLVRFDHDFANWQELAAFREKQIRKLTPQLDLDLGELTPEDVRPLVDVAEDWLNAGDTETSTALAARLLADVPSLQTDDVLRKRLLRVEEQRRKTILPLTEPRTETHRRAREQWKRVQGGGY